MTSVGDVSISLSLDDSQFQQGIRQISNTELKPLNLGVSLDTTEVLRGLSSLNRLAVPELKIAATLDTSEVRRELRSFSRTSTQISVAASLDSKALQQDIKALKGGQVSVRASLDDSGIRAELSRLNGGIVQVRTALDSSGLEREIDAVSNKKVPTVEIEARLEATKALQQLDDFVRLRPSIEVQAELDNAGLIRDLSALKGGQVAVEARLSTTTFRQDLKSMEGGEIKIAAALDTGTVRHELESLYQASNRKIELGVSLDRTQLNRELDALGSTGKPQIKIGASLEAASIQRELQNLSNTTTQTRIAATLDSRQLQRDLDALDRRTLSVGAQVDTSAVLRDLEQLVKTDGDAIAFKAVLDVSDFDRTLTAIQTTDLTLPLITIDTGKARKEISDLQLLAKDAIQLSASLNVDSARKELEALSKIPVQPLSLEVFLDKAKLERQIRELREGDYGAIPIELIPGIRGFERKLRDLPKSLVDAIAVEVRPNIKLPDLPPATWRIVGEVQPLELPTPQPVAVPVEYALAPLDIPQPQATSVPVQYQLSALELPQTETLVVPVEYQFPALTLPSSDSISVAVEYEFAPLPSLDELVLRPLTIAVDDSRLYELNEHLDLKKEHFNAVQQHFDANPLTPRVNTNAIKTLETSAQNLDLSQQLDAILVPVKYQVPALELPQLDGVVVPVEFKIPELEIRVPDNVLVAVNYQIPALSLRAPDDVLVSVEYSVPTLELSTPMPVLASVEYAVPSLVLPPLDSVAVPIEFAVPPLELPQIDAVFLPVQYVVPTLELPLRSHYVAVEYDVPPRIELPQPDSVQVPVEYLYPTLELSNKKIAIAVSYDIAPLDIPKGLSILVPVRYEPQSLDLPDADALVVRIEYSIPDLELPQPETIVAQVLYQIPELELTQIALVVVPVEFKVSQINLPTTEKLVVPVSFELGAFPQIELPAFDPLVVPVLLDVPATIELPQLAPLVTEVLVDVPSSIELPQIDSVEVLVQADLQTLRKQVDTIKTKLLNNILVKLVLDTSGLQRQFQNGTNNVFGSIPINLRPELEEFDHSLKSGLSQKKYSTEVGLNTNNFKDNIKSAFTDALKQVQGKGLFSNFASILTAPFKLAVGAIAPIFLGLGASIGLPLGTQIGTGLAKGLQSRFGNVIGSFELLGESLTTGVATKVGNTFAFRFANAILQSEELQSLTSSLRGLLTETLGESNILIESTSAKANEAGRQRVKQTVAQREIGQSLLQEIENKPTRNKEIKRVESRLSSAKEETARKRLALQNTEANTQLKIARLSPFDPGFRASVEKYNLEIDRATVSLKESAIKERTLEKLINQIKNEPARITGQLKLAGADITALEDIEVALKGSAVKGQEIITRIDGNIKIQQSNIQEARQRVKNFNELARTLKEEAIAALGQGNDSTAKDLLVKSKKATILAGSAQQEVNSYKTNITENIGIKKGLTSDFVQQRKQLRQQLETERKTIAESAASLQVQTLFPGTGLELGPGLGSDATINRQSATPKALITAARPTAVPLKKGTTLSTFLPITYEKIVEEVAKTLKTQILPNQVPSLINAGAQKYSGLYTAFNNSISLPTLNFDKLGNNLDPQVVKTIIHELRHALQTNFGKQQLTEFSKNPTIDLLKGTPQELERLQKSINASTLNFKKGSFSATQQDVEVISRLEEDAYVFAERNFQQIYDTVQKTLQGLSTQNNLSLAQPIGTSRNLPEPDVVAELKRTQAEITNNLRRSFKGKPKKRQVINPELGSQTLTKIDEQLQFASNQLLREDLSQPTLNLIKLYKGTLEKQYRTYSPAIRNFQKEELATGIGLSQGQLRSTRITQGNLSTTNPTFESGAFSFNIEPPIDPERSRGVNLEGTFKPQRRAEPTSSSNLDIFAQQETIQQELTRQQVATRKQVIARRNAEINAELASLKQIAQFQTRIQTKQTAQNLKAERQRKEARSAAIEAELRNLKQEELAQKQALEAELARLKSQIPSSTTPTAADLTVTPTILNAQGKPISPVAPATTPTIFSAQGKPVSRVSVVAPAILNAQGKPVKPVAPTTSPTVGNAQGRPVSRVSTAAPSILNAQGKPVTPVAPTVTPIILNAQGRPIKAKSTVGTASSDITFLEKSLQELDKLIQQIDVQKAAQFKEAVARAKADLIAMRRLNATYSARRIRSQSKTVDKALSGIEAQTDQEIATREIEGRRKLGRLENKLQRKYDITPSMPPGANIPQPQQEARSILGAVSGGVRSVFKGIQTTRFDAAKKQAQTLEQQARIVLTDIESQIVVGRTAENEAKVVNTDIKRNEKAIQLILNAIKRSRTGKGPKFDQGQLNQLAQQVQELSGQIDKDQAKLAGLNQKAAKGRELQPFAQGLGTAIAGVGREQGRDGFDGSALKRLQAYNTELRQTLTALGQEPPNKLFSSLGDLFAGLDERSQGLLRGLGNLVKGFLAFQVGTVLVGTLRQAIAESTQTAIKFESLAIAMKATSGGAIQASKNLEFVRNEANKLRVPLAPAIEGFTKFSAAVKGTPLERSAQSIFSGVTQAITVMGLGGEEAQGVYLALQQMAGKGKVSAEEFRSQLQERLPQATAVASRALGVTTEQFTKMLDSGQILSQDFLPRFAAQLASETQGSVAESANTGQAALNRFNNSIEQIKLTVGQSTLPIQKLGLNTLSGIFEIASKNAQLLITVLAGLTVSIASFLVPLIVKLPLFKALLLGVGVALDTLAASLKSIAIQFVAVAGAIELVKLSNLLINGGELAKEFKILENAARDAAKAVRDAKQEAADFQPPSTPPDVTPSDFLVRQFREGVNLLTQNGPFGSVDAPDYSGIFSVTFSELDRDRSIESIYKSGGAIRQAFVDVKQQIKDAATGKINLALLPDLDKQIQAISQKRQVLQGQITREFVSQGKAVPLQFKDQLASLNQEYEKLTQRRVDLAKPFAEESNKFQQTIDSIKSQLRTLETPKGRAKFAGADISGLTAELESQLKLANEAKAGIDKLLASYNADPVQDFVKAIRKLNLELAKNSELAQLAFSKERASITQTKVRDFSTNITAPQEAALATATAERDQRRTELTGLEANFQKNQTAIAAPEFQFKLTEFNLTPTSTVAEIQDRIDRPNTEEADKQTLEKIKQAREAELKLSEGRNSLFESEAKLQETRQQNALDSLQRFAADRQAINQRTANDEIAQVQKQLKERKITEEKGAAELAGIEYESTARQIGDIDQQLAGLRSYYAQGAISAQAFHDKERELVTQGSDLRKQLAQQDLTYTEAVYKRVLAGIEQANQKVEAAIARNQTIRNTNAKSLQLDLLRTPGDQKANEFQVRRLTIDADTQAATERVGLLKTQLEQVRISEESGLITAKQAFGERIRLQQELASQNDKLADNEIQQERLRQEQAVHNIEIRIQRQKNLSDLTISGIEQQRASQQLLNESLDRTQKLEQSRLDLSKALSDAAIATGQIELDAANKALELRRRLNEENLDPGVRSEIGNQLARSGFNPGASELEFVERRQAIENEIEAERRTARENEEKFQRQMLRIELERQRIVAETAAYEAESNFLRAQQGKIEAQGKLKNARTLNDQPAIDAALIGLEIAERQLELSSRQVSSAQQGLKIQGELAGNAIKAQEVSQSSSRSQFESTNAARQQAQALERAEAAVGKIQNTASPVRTDNFGVSSSFDERTIKKKRPSLFEQSRQQVFAIPEIRRTVSGGVVHNANVDQSKHRGLNPLTSVEAYFKRQFGLNPQQSAEAYFQQARGLKPGQSAEEYFNQLSGLIPSQLNPVAPPVQSVAPQAKDTFQLPGLLQDQPKLLQQLLDPSNLIDSILLAGSASTQGLVDASKPLDAGVKQPSGYDSFVEGLREANRGIEAKLDKLIEVEQAAARSPRSLHVSSPNPVADGARIWGEITRQSAIANGFA